MSYSIQVTFVGQTDKASYQTKSTSNEFIDYYVENSQTRAEYYAAIAANDTTGLWATHGTDIISSWATMHSITFDADTQTLTYVIDWTSKEVYDHWQAIKQTLDFTDEDFEDIDITYQYLNKTETTV